MAWNTIRNRNLETQMCVQVSPGLSRCAIQGYSFQEIGNVRQWLRQGRLRTTPGANRHLMLTARLNKTNNVSPL